jgi:hypothetical protein
MGQIQIDFIYAAGSPRLTLAFGIHPLVSLLRFPRILTIEYLTRRTTYQAGREAMMLPLKISRSTESIPIGATKNRLNRNFRRAMITIMTTIIMIM